MATHVPKVRVTTVSFGRKGWCLDTFGLVDVFQVYREQKPVLCKVLKWESYLFGGSTLKCKVMANFRMLRNSTPFSLKEHHPTSFDQGRTVDLQWITRCCDIQLMARRTFHSLYLGYHHWEVWLDVSCLHTTYHHTRHHRLKGKGCSQREVNVPWSRSTKDAQLFFSTKDSRKKSNNIKPNNSQSSNHHVSRGPRFLEVFPKVVLVESCRSSTALLLPVTWHSWGVLNIS